MRKILLVQGANLTYLGKREPAIYGTTTAEELNETLLQHSREKGYQLEIFYSNIEGEAINRKGASSGRVIPRTRFRRTPLRNKSGCRRVSDR